MRKNLQYLFRELPKVTTLLVVGAIILFPMYMMIVMSFMTPAQIEYFPWFPRSLPIPQALEAPRGGAVKVRPAVLELRRAGQAPQRITLPVDYRFYVYLGDNDVSRSSWTVSPGSGGGVAGPGWAVVAELRAGNVWDVAERGDGAFDIDGRLCEAPAGFVPVLRGLEIKARARAELQAVDAAFERAREALRATDRAERANEPAERSRLETEAVAAYLETAVYAEVAERAADRVRALAREAAGHHVALDAEQESAAEKLHFVQVAGERLRKRIADYYSLRHELARALVKRPTDKPVGPREKFKVDRSEAVALLLTDKPTEVALAPGELTVDTVWAYELQRKRLLRVAPLVEKTGPEGRAPVPGEPLADLVAARDFELVWSEGRWLCEGRPLAEFLPPGFKLLIPDGPPTMQFEHQGAPAQSGRARLVEQGSVVARATAPKVVAVVSGDALLVGLAQREDDGTFRIAPGEGRWSYPLRADRNTPFAVRTVVAVKEQSRGSDGAGGRELAADFGDRIAELYVNRQRTIVGELGQGWISVKDNVRLNVPSGFVSDFAQPTKAGETRILTPGLILGELCMPRATLVVDDDFLLVKMTGSQWGDGQWEYPLGELETLQVATCLAGGPSTSSGPPLDPARGGESIEPQAAPRGGPWEVNAGAPVAEIRAMRRAVLTYVNQRWQLEGRPVGLWLNEDVLKYAISDVREAARRLEEIKRRRQLSGPRGEAAGDAAALADEERLAALQLDKAGRALAEADRASGFIPLTGPGQPLASDLKRVVVEPGTVLARLRAEGPVEGEAGPQAADAGMKTVASVDGSLLKVAFTHRLRMPGRANPLVKEGDQLIPSQELCAFFTPQWLDKHNYVEAWGYVQPFVINTIIVAVTTMVLSLFFASLSAFVFSRFEFPGKALLYGMIIVLLMIPGVLNLVPLYVIVKNLGLLNQPLNMLGRLNAILVIVLPAVAGGQVMNVYIMRNNLETLAKDLFDAARIDGATNFQTYWHIAIPLSRPIMGTLAIFVLLSEWNNFIWPWVVLREQEFMTITAGLAKLEGQHLSDYGLQMAGAVLASLPLVVLFFFTMNLFIRGMQSGAIKA